MLTYEEFMKLPPEERKKRYVELSSHDKFRVRTSAPFKATLIKKGNAKELTKEEKEIVANRRKSIEKQIEEYNKKHNKSS